MFREAHGGRQQGKMIWRDMIVFYEEMEASDRQRTGGGDISGKTGTARPSSQESLMAGTVVMDPWWRTSVQCRRSDAPMSIEYSRNVRETDSYVAVYPPREHQARRGDLLRLINVSYPG